MLLGINTVFAKLETFRLDYENEFDYEYDFLETFRFDYEYKFDYEYDLLETFRFDYEYEFDYEYDFLETFRFDYEYEFDYEYDFLETFRFDYEYEFDYEYDFLETFRFDYEYDFLAFALVMLTSRSSASLAINTTATRFDPTMILRTPVKNLIVPKVVLVLVKFEVLKQYKPII